jgi:23S rRNA (adenine2030-N6)-methyltransferase
MTYRHAYHAGNFADLVKHAALTLLLEAMTRGEPLAVIDTHAGAGAYDLSGPEAMKTQESAGGIARLMAEPSPPEAFDILIAAVARDNTSGALQVYPGSPALICAALREQDRLTACELRPDDFAELETLLAPLHPQARALRTDGFVEAARLPAKGPALVLIDPPFERGDDYDRCVAACAAVLARNPGAVVAVWVPLKDLETFDRFLRGLEVTDPPTTLIAEARLRALDNPLAMNGCAMVILGAPDVLDVPMAGVCDWVAKTSGEAGGRGRVWRL